MLRIHQSVAWFVLCANALVGIWAIVGHWYQRIVVPALWWCIAIAYGAVVVQVSIGIYLVTLGGYQIAGTNAGPGGVAAFHVFYGVIGVIAVAIAWIYSRSSEWVAEHRELFFGLFSLFVMGLAIRAMITVNAV
ncbi:MAG: hypothetical protein K1X95_10780 [Acidimicrobiia bacterium]|nr:hypothetical protein [Acidimicrobiia bacterium]